jgi:hypothetical protein
MRKSHAHLGTVGDRLADPSDPHKPESNDLQPLPDAAGGDRTHDLRIKSPLLCQLSYGGQA